MSIQAVAWVLDHSAAQGSIRLVLIAVANHANKDDPWCWLSYDTIAWESGISRSTAIRSVARARDGGFLEVDEGGGRAHTNRYRVVVDDPAVTRERPEKRSRSDTPPDRERVSSRSVKGVIRDAKGCHGRDPNQEQPSLTTFEEPNGASPDGDFGSPSAREKRPNEEAARAVADRVWELSDPKPAVKWIAITKLAERFLDAGHGADAVVDAMLGVPTISLGWVEGRLNGARAKAPPPRAREQFESRTAPGGQIR